MGQQRRYAAWSAAGISRQIEKLAHKPEPVSLFEDEIAGTGKRRQAEGDGIPVEAWVRHIVHYEEAHRVVGRAVEFTDSAVLVEFNGEAGQTHRAWVWASAVRRAQREKP
ncbi:hypothetical protein [Leifsonia sp. Leaf264]|uniref:hypothetical protein n=1 Tax=Leifsonia sp. Leaf264 TaxID=1736314 RepID=UPI0006FA65DF|nr:hypothetical protein [Leifsonia sp. Leaf264]KQP01442.1 hypothetical protein ASF30_02150 [Leifsonia sp. Leaf264]